MSGPRILVVDDDVDYVAALTIVLETNGYEVAVAYDGKEGLEKAKCKMPQVMLVDLMMNTINEGYDLVRDIRDDDRFEGMPLIMISAAHQVEAFKNANFAPDDAWFPIDTFMDKPVDFEVLLAHLDRLLKKQES